MASDLQFLVEPPGIEVDALPGNMPSELRLHYVSFPFNPAHYLRFPFSALDGVKSGHHLRYPVARGAAVLRNR
jgi:hypothetical protein